MALPLHDTHFHLDLYPDPRSLLLQIEASRTHTVAVTNTPSVFPSTATLVSGARYVRPAIGLHPELAAERRGELDLFWQHLPTTRYVGEIGLDYVTQDLHDRAHQRHVFDEIIERCDAAGDKVLTVHSRRAESDVIGAIGEGFRGSVILHWYSGSLKNLKIAVERGFYFSVNPAMARGKRFPALLDRIPRDRLLLETDGPFVTVEKRPAVPDDTLGVVRRVADLWDVADDEAAHVIYQNFRCLLAAPPL